MPVVALRTWPVTVWIVAATEDAADPFEPGNVLIFV